MACSHKSSMSCRSSICALPSAMAAQTALYCADLEILLLDADCRSSCASMESPSLLASSSSNCASFSFGSTGESCALPSNAMLFPNAVAAHRRATLCGTKHHGPLLFALHAVVAHYIAGLPLGAGFAIAGPIKNAR